MDQESLIKAIKRAIDNPAFRSKPDGTTFCNLFCQQILNDLGCHDLDGLIAREMGEKVLDLIALSGDSMVSWQEVTWQKSIEIAKIGYPVLGWSPCLLEEHGHVVIIAPEEPELSKTFGGLVPMCASISRYPFENRIQKISEAYRIADKPRYLAWLG